MPSVTQSDFAPKPSVASGASGLYEEALQKLEAIVETMETGDLPLDKMLTQYEEGVRLAQQCQSKLAEAEIKIEQLEKNALGEASLRPIVAGSPENE